MNEYGVKRTYVGLKQPIGYLSPDGEWYLLEHETNHLAHLAISEYLENEVIPPRSFNGEIMVFLENTGWLKVDGRNIRYYADEPYYKYREKHKTPHLTERQRDAIIEYCRYGSDNGLFNSICFNGWECFNRTYHQLREMDELMWRKLFVVANNETIKLMFEENLNNKE